MSTARAGQPQAADLKDHVNEGLADERRRNVRRSALLLAAVALAFYLGFIVLSVMCAI